MTLPGFFEGTEMPDPGWWEALWPDPARVIRDAGIAPGMTVVDLCSGDGWFTLQLSRIARAVVAIDIDGKLLETARVRLAESGLANCVFIEANAFDLAKVVRDRVDHVFLANAFHGVPDKRGHDDARQAPKMFISAASAGLRRLVALAIPMYIS